MPWNRTYSARKQNVVNPMPTKTNRERPIPIQVYFSEHEISILDRKMALIGTENKSAFIRKMAIDGMIIKTDFSDIRTLCSHVGKASGIINQIVKRVNETTRYYDEDIAEIKQKQAEMLRLIHEIGDKIL